MGRDEPGRLFLNSARGLANDFDIADNGGLGLMIAFQGRCVIDLLK